MEGTEATVVHRRLQRSDGRGGEERGSAAGNDVEEGKEAECGGVGAVSREAGTATRPRPRSNPA